MLQDNLLTMKSKVSYSNSLNGPKVKSCIFLFRSENVNQKTEFSRKCKQTGNVA